MLGKTYQLALFSENWTQKVKSLNKPIFDDGRFDNIWNKWNNYMKLSHELHNTHIWFIEDFFIDKGDIMI